MTTSQPGRIDGSAWDSEDATDPAMPRPTPTAPNSDHCIFDSVRGAFVCERCKAEHAVTMPVDVMAFTEMAGAWLTLHGGCST